MAKSLVRKILLFFENQLSKAYNMSCGSHRYLHIAVRLFSASSGRFNPLKMGPVHGSTNRPGDFINAGQIPRMQDYENARVAFDWDDAETPAAFLKRVFGDDDSSLPMDSVGYLFFD
ncbi:hypothetical protein NHQ30_001438 [Ciborinia camelliae]|nr:hypothetical protein NHQ30_001438 [Ciborinia camelliae]